MKKILWIPALMTLIFACGGITEEVETYEDKENGYSIDLPKGWEVEKQGEDEEYLLIIAHSPSTGLLDDFTENINIGRENTSGFDLDTYMNLSLDNMNTLEEFELVEEGSLEAAETEGRFFIYEHSYEGFRVKALSFVAFDGDIAYLVTCTATQETYLDYEELFLKVCRSFKAL